MFNRYWRDYPWFLQLVQFIILTFVMFSFFVLGLGTVVVPMLTGYRLEQVATISSESPFLLRQAALLWQFLYSLGTFLIPPLLFAYVTHPRPSTYLGFRKPGKSVHWIIVPLLMLGLMLVMLQMSHWIELLPFWSEATRAEADRMEKTTMALTEMPSALEYLKILSLMALLPALGEELFFRGVLLRFAARKSTTMVLPILLSALMFAFVHLNTFGLIPIFLAGVVLALIYYWTGSIWLSILAHFLNNGLQITLMYLSEHVPSFASLKDANEIPMPLFAAGLVLAAFTLWWLWRERTPMPNSWSEDFTPEELVEEGR